MKITAGYITANKFIEIIEKWLAVLFILAIVIIVFAGTLSRYLLDNPIYGADRLATYLMIWLGFFGFQIAVSRLRHIEVEFVKARMKPAIRYLMNIGTSLIAFVFMVILFCLSLRYLLEVKQLGDEDIVLGIPMWLILLIMPLSFGLSALRYFFNSFLWNDVRTGKREEHDIVQKKLI
ncbi:MAG: TRAP transporter small permease [Bacteroidetes bacterium]|nr:TRAP transporter small permease [Bacteroidota bacterium]